jgi:Na+/phosphate symporter
MSIVNLSPIGSRKLEELDWTRKAYYHKNKGKSQIPSHILVQHDDSEIKEWSNNLHKNTQKKKKHRSYHHQFVKEANAGLINKKYIYKNIIIGESEGVWPWWE